MNLKEKHLISGSGLWLTELKSLLFESKHVWYFYGSCRIVFACFWFSLEPKHKEAGSPGVPGISKTAHSNQLTTWVEFQHVSRPLSPLCSE